MELDADSRALLSSARIGMLALNSGNYPLVNPAAFHFGGDSIWMTTSRHAVKVALARRSPAASFLVDSGRQCLLLEGDLEVYDPLSIPGQVRAVMEGPGFYLNLAGYAMKNAAFIGGYLRDLAGIPGDWWPQNRTVIRLRARRVWALPPAPSLTAGPATLPGVPPGVRRSLARVPVAYLCTVVDDVPLMAPALWGADGSLALVTGVAGFLGLGRNGDGGVAIESHHAYRATRMVGAYLRGRFRQDSDAKDEIQSRYELAGQPSGMGIQFDPVRATWWRGFDLQSSPVAAAAIQKIHR